MIIILIVYVSFGIISNIMGPLADEINDMIKQIRRANSTPTIQKKLLLKKKAIVGEITLRVLTILFYPILYPILLQHLIITKKHKQMDPVRLSDSRIYFWKLGGSGIFHCHDCNFEKEIVTFLHGAKGWNVTGYQCQECGDFHNIERDSNNKAERRCDCGGILKKDNPIFCPNCRSFHVGYDVRIMT
jgi:hypothetical protein